MKRLAYWLYTAACALAIALTLVTVAHAAPCRWDRPGADPFMGEVPAAVDRYLDIPADVRAILRGRMQRHAYDDVVDVRRDSIVGAHRYDSAIRDMHFGQGRVCATVTRQRWADDTHERGLVYCESGHCVMVPTVCRNVSRVTRLHTSPPMALTGTVESFETLAAVPALAEAREREQVTSSTAEWYAVDRHPPRFTYGSAVDVGTVPVTPVPEPAAWALMLAGLLVLVTRRWVRV
jgi:hypothetical protein